MKWARLITDLETVGMTQAEIAAQTGCSQPYVSQLKSGDRAKPGYEVGSALESLHRRRCQRSKPGRRSAA